jgi:enediyne biosynthesis protein E4
VVNCNDGPALILMNRGGNGNHWLLVNTVGTRSNRDGVGASIRVTSRNGEEQYGFVRTCGSYASASDRRVHFGLGSATGISRLEVTWPSGIVQTLGNVEIDRVLTITEPQR